MLVDRLNPSVLSVGNTETTEPISGENDNTYYGIGAYTTEQGEFIVEADMSAPLNTQVDFNISWGYSATSECEGDCVEQANLI